MINGKEKIIDENENKKLKNVSGFFNSKSIAVVGASKNSKKIGHQILKNIILGGFSGKIYPINLKEKRILGHKAYTKVTEVRGKIDLAIIAIPAEFVPEVLKECGEKGIKNAVIISAGFSESSEKGGKLLEENLKEIANQNNIKILGPNCLGFIVSQNNLNATFASSFPRDGHLSIISQSGALASAMLDWAKKNKVGISTFASLGNKAGLKETDLLNLMENDPKTKLVLIYLEDTENGPLLMEKLVAVTRKKPVIMVKGGVTSKGEKAALSHTGALASSSKVFLAALKQSDTIVTDTLQQAFNTTFTLYHQLTPSKKDLAIITNAGGPGIITTDLASQNNIPLPEPRESLKENLKQFLPLAASLNNPIDLLGDASARTYQKTLKMICENEQYGSVLVLLTPQTSTEIIKTANLIAKVSQNTDKLILASFIGGEKVEKGKKILISSGVPCFDFPDQAIEVLSKVLVEKTNQNIVESKPENNLIQKIDKIIKVSPPDKSYQIAKTFGLPVVRTELIRSKEELSYVAKSMGYPLVFKTLSSKVVHKKFAGGVQIDIKSEEELTRYYEKITKKFGPLVSLSPFVEEGFELYIGAKRDPLFGPCVLFGLGGNYVESLNDIVLRVFPISKEEAFEMMHEIRAKKILKNLTLEKLANIILKTGELITSVPEIMEIDFNPVKTTYENALILDSRIVLKNKF